MNQDGLDIPDFARMTDEHRRAAWKGRKLTKVKAWVAPKREEPADVKAFRLKLEREKAAKQKERFEMLRERKAAERRAGANFKAVLTKPLRARR